MFSIRTDLALEAREMCIAKKEEKDEEGIRVDIDEDFGLTITRMNVFSEKTAQKIGKPIGNYVTIEAPDVMYSIDIYEKVAKQIADEIRKMVNIESHSKILVVGLGNSKITPDALGPDVVSKLIVTGHIKEYKKELLSDDFSSVYAIAPGVLGTTGIESVDVIKAVCDKVKPDVLIAVDALASRSLKRISTTFQLSDSGIQPGAGVLNSRKALNKETLGVTVVAIGVPTVVDALTVALDSIESVTGNNDDGEKLNDIIKNELSDNIKTLMVTPKDIDLVIEKTSKTIANGINLALHENLTFEEIESYVG